MLDIKMSKEADALLSVLYAAYKSRRKEGMSKSSAKEFDPDFFQDVEPLSNWNADDLSEARVELKSNGLVKTSIVGECELTENAIAIMEDRVKDGLLAGAEFVSKFIP